MYYTTFDSHPQHEYTTVTNATVFNETVVECCFHYSNETVCSNTTVDKGMYVHLYQYHWALFWIVMYSFHCSIWPCLLMNNMHCVGNVKF